MVLLVIGSAVALKAVIPPERGMPPSLVREESMLVDPKTELSNAKGIGVEVGTFIENFHSLSLRQRIFNAEGFYWLEWPRELQDLMVAQGITPLQLVEITNLVNASSAQIEPDTVAPVQKPADRFYQLFRYSANLYIPMVDLRRSPFEKLVLPVVLEVSPEGFSHQEANVVLVPDSNKKNSQVGSGAYINGYDIDTVRSVSSRHSYGTNWGFDQGDLDFSRLSTELVMKGDPFSSFVTWILPLMIVMLIVLLAPLLDGELGEIRLAIPSTALLTLIFLQQTYKAELPLLSYLTFLDFLYAYSYIVSVVLFVLFLWRSNAYAGSPDQHKGEALKMINRVDRVFQLSAFTGFFVVAAVAWSAW
ncbi:hypothetical protein [Synechococcus sp. Tobar12-5m-g]|uniref:hypothetical protein n=1 Tax=Synechococcus sp. Tobar12-5m-g TaxID=2823742 RepID=UPI0020CE3554|nr:hypothetical protein [Synechococcus sp. Tobar12-5m-g]MCP9873616.1 hypothetical protein [Synechococcus sp. Cruz CV-v-12]